MLVVGREVWRKKHRVHAKLSTERIDEDIASLSDHESATEDAEGAACVVGDDEHRSPDEYEHDDDGSPKCSGAIDGNMGEADHIDEEGCAENGPEPPWAWQGTKVSLNDRVAEAYQDLSD